MSALTNVQRITSVASDGVDAFAYIVRIPEEASIRYDLYLARSSEAPRRMITARFMENVTFDAISRQWTIRADLGEGTQIYGVSQSGRTSLVAGSEFIPVITGPYVYPMGGFGEPINTAVSAYDRSPDGRCMWFSVLETRTTDQVSAIQQRGIVYDPESMTPNLYMNDPGRIVAERLYVACQDGQPRMLLRVPYTQHMNLGSFFSGPGSWTIDSKQIRFLRMIREREDRLEWSFVDLAGNVSTPPGEMSSASQAISLPGGAVLRLREASGGNFLEVTRGEKTQSFQVAAKRLIREEMNVSSDGGRLIVATSYGHGQGLLAVDVGRGSVREQNGPGSYKNCATSWTSGTVACVYEALTVPPEVVTLRMSDLQPRHRIRVDSAFVNIVPLRYQWMRWKNRLGSESDGYILFPRNYFPRNYKSGEAYPAILISHGNDVRDEFSRDALQWSFPLQVLAENGYIVVAVNEPVGSARIRGDLARGVTIEQAQFGHFGDAIAMFEEVTRQLVAQRLADPLRIGIAGFSRGGELVGYALTQSNIFATGVIVESGLGVSGYMWGSSLTRRYFEGLYGGGPFDRRSNVVRNYDRYMPTLRAAHASGPLLQIVAGVSSSGSTLEAFSAWRSAHRPAEIVFYPGENHTFWNPTHRRSAMWRIMDWYGFWLRGEERVSVEDETQYARWRAYREEWKAQSVLEAAGHALGAIPTSVPPVTLLD